MQKFERKGVMFHSVISVDFNTKLWNDFKKCVWFSKKCSEIEPFRLNFGH